MGSPQQLRRSATLLLLAAAPRAAAVLMATTNLYDYAPMDSKMSDGLAAMGGFANFTHLAGRLGRTTSGEAVLLASGRTDLLEYLAPELLWRRRGPPAAGGSTVPLGASRLPGAGHASTTMYKLRHDVEQLEWLAAKGVRSHFRRADVPLMNRGAAAAATSMEMSRGDAAAATWIFQGDDTTPWPRRGYSLKR